MSSTYTDIIHTNDILKTFLLKPKTKTQYTQCLSSFLTYIQIHFHRSPIFSHSLSSSSSSTSSAQLISELDRLLCNYMNYLYSGHGKYYQASYTYNSLCYYIPQCKLILYESKQRLKAWDKKGQKEKIYKTPLTKELTHVIAVSLLNANYIHSAIGVLLSFECYLRIGELCSIRICDIGKPSSSSCSSYSSSFTHSYTHTGMVIGLKETKTGPNQSVIVRDPLVCSLILLLLSTHTNQNEKSTDKLFSFDAMLFRRHFASACDALHLSSYHFTPHCLRHGGASHDYIINQNNLNTIVERGRWAIVQSARTYIQSATYLSIHLKEKHLTNIGKTIIHSSNHLFDLFHSKLHSL